MTAELLQALDAALSGPGTRLLAWDHDEDGDVHVCEVSATGAQRVFKASGLANERGATEARAAERGIRIGALHARERFVWVADETYALWNETGVVAHGRDGGLSIGDRSVPRADIRLVESFWDRESAGDNGVHVVLTSGERVPVVGYTPSVPPDPFVVSWYESELFANYAHWIARDLANWLGVEHQEQDRVFNAVELAVQPFARELADAGTSPPVTVDGAAVTLSLAGDAVVVGVAFAAGLVRESAMLRQGPPAVLRAYLRGVQVGADVGRALVRLRTKVQPRLRVDVLAFAGALATPGVVAAWDSTDDRDTDTLNLYEVGRRGATHVATLTVGEDLWHDLHATLTERAIRIGTCDTRRLCVWVGDGEDLTVWTDRKQLAGSSLHGDRGWPRSLARDLARWSDAPMRELRALADLVAALPATGPFEEVVAPGGGHQLRVAGVPGAAARFIELRVRDGNTTHGRWLRMGTSGELARYLRSLRTLRDIARAASSFRSE